MSQERACQLTAARDLSARLDERSAHRPPALGKADPARYVRERDINVRYNERMDFQQPVEAVIPGATGRLLAALARVDTELPISTLATVAGVGRTTLQGSSLSCTTLESWTEGRSGAPRW